MEENPFENHELCDGHLCVIRDVCARYIGNIDIGNPDVNHYVILNRRPIPLVCPYYISIPDENYPPKDTVRDY